MDPLLMIGFAVLAVASLLVTFRCLRGPEAFDRILAFDCLVLQMIGFIMLLSITERSAAYMDIILIVSLLGFIGTVSFAYFLGRSNGH